MTNFSKFEKFFKGGKMVEKSVKFQKTGKFTQFFTEKWQINKITYFYQNFPILVKFTQKSVYLLIFGKLTSFIEVY